MFRNAKEAADAAARAVKHAKSVEVAEGRREARRQKLAEEKAAREAEHNSSYAGLMDPGSVAITDWDDTHLGAESSSGGFAMKTEVREGSFSRFTGVSYSCQNSVNNAIRSYLTNISF